LERNILLKKHLNENVCLYIERDGEVLHESNIRGIGALTNIYINNKSILKNSTVVDKIIGKAASVILILSGVKEVYGETMSESGFLLLQKYNITAFYDKKVPMIINREGNDMCPMEKAVIDMDNLNDGFEKIIKTLSSLSQN